MPYWLKAGVACVIFSAIALHTALLLEYNLPSNLLDPSFRGIIDSYVIPYLGQNWSLFAPNPGGYVVSYRVRYRFILPGGNVQETPFVSSTSLFPTSFSAPFNSLGLMREVSYACAGLAENAAAFKLPKHPVVALPDVVVPADRVNASTSCIARVALSLAPGIRRVLMAGARDDRRPINQTEVQVVLMLAAAPRVKDAFASSNVTDKPLEYEVVHSTPWMTSSRVDELPADVEVGEE